MANFKLLEEVNEVYEEVSKICAVTEEENPEKKKNFISNILDSISGIFVSIIPVLIAEGMISAILVLLTTFNLVSIKSGTYGIISSIQGAIFNFLPLFVGYAAGVKFKCNPFIGTALGAVLCYSKITGVGGLNFLGISIRAITYTSSLLLFYNIIRNILIHLKSGLGIPCDIYPIENYYNKFLNVKFEKLR